MMHLQCMAYIVCITKFTYWTPLLPSVVHTKPHSRRETTFSQIQCNFIVLIDNKTGSAEQCPLHDLLLAATLQKIFFLSSVITTLCPNILVSSPKYNSQ